MQTTLSLSELEYEIGRLFMAGIPGTTLDDGTKELIQRYGLGGVILFSRNIENPIQLATLCKDLQGVAISSHGFPLFLSIDQEGGRVARLPEPFSIFPGNESIGKDSDPTDSAIEFAQVTSHEMALVGLNMDLAPVVDVRGEKTEKHLEGRTFSNDPEKVASLSATVVEVLQENGVMAVAKHFPGLGLTTLDPHHQLPTIEVSLEDIEEKNLMPFKATIKSGVSAIMTSHAIYPALDPDNSATLSKKVLIDLLRDKLHFEGLIITDDLEMGAIEKKWGVAEGAVLSFEAGADILLICKDQGNVLKGMLILKEKLIRGEISYERFRQSLTRVAEAKSKFLKESGKVSLERVQSYFSP